jgi:uncharacterized protein YecE (DUF72 family)
MESGGIRIGTCSWTEKSLLESGAFYPPEITTAAGRLRYYASRFDTVEVESSYFTIPTLQMTCAWLKRTPQRFLFHFKAYGALTGHQIDPQLLPAELRELLSEEDRAKGELHVGESAVLKALALAMAAALEPLRAAGKLGFLIFQFPPWFNSTKRNRDYLLYCKELMNGLPIAVEFRHRSWLAPGHAQEIFSFLREHHITYVTCDEPQCGTQASVPFSPEATTPVAYLRLHGRNAEAWLGDSPLRYDYRYGREELAEIAGAIRELSSRTRTTFVMFKNCHAGHAVCNAQQLRELLTHRSPPPGG